MTIVTDTTAAESERAGSPAPLKPVRVAVAGCSRFGIVQAAATTSIPNAELVGLAETRPTVRREVRGIGFQAPMFDRLATLLAKTHPDALIVGGPPSLRPKLIREALEAGIAVLTERPLGGDLMTAESLTLLARERNVPFACAHALVFHPVFAEARRIVAAGALGAPRRIRCSTYHSRVFDPARQAAVAALGPPHGVLAHEALDAIFFLIEMFGAPRSARASLLHLFGPLEDEAHVMMTLASGVEIGLDASWSVPGYPAAATVLELESEHGKLLVSDDALELDLQNDHPTQRAGHTRLGLADLPQPARFDVDGESSYLAASAFLAWVAGGEPPVHRADRAIRAQRVLDALYASARNGGADVPLAAS